MTEVQVAGEGGESTDYDRHNSLAITALEQAISWCVARTIGRVKRGVSGQKRP